MKKPLLFIDTDMGVDDIIAICMTVASNAFTIGGISAVNGVVSVRTGIRNLARMLSYLGVSIPLYYGIDRKTQGTTVQFPSIDRFRAKTLALLPNTPLPNVLAEYRPLAQLSKDMLTANQPVTILCLGPLSNIVRLLARRDIRAKVQRLIIMGGALNVAGTVPPRNVAEYNIRLDPTAARDVLKSGIPTTLVPIDATRFVPASTNNPRSAAIIAQIKQIRPSTRIGRIIREITIRNDGDFQQFYDPLAAAILLKPNIVTKTLDLPLGVVTRGKNTGKLYDTRSGPLVSLVSAVNTKRFYLFLSSLLTRSDGI